MYGVIRNDIVNKQKLTLSSTQEQPLAKQSQILRSLKNRIKNQPPIWFPARLWEQFEEKGKILKSDKTLSSIPEWSFVFSQNWVLYFPRIEFCIFPPSPLLVKHGICIFEQTVRFVAKSNVSRGGVRSKRVPVHSSSFAPLLWPASHWYVFISMLLFFIVDEKKLTQL